MKNKYIINGEKVPDLKAWCIKKGLSVKSFNSAINRAKHPKDKNKHPSNESRCLGYMIIRL